MPVGISPAVSRILDIFCTRLTIRYRLRERPIADATACMKGVQEACMINSVSQPCRLGVLEWDSGRGGITEPFWRDNVNHRDLIVFVSSWEKGTARSGIFISLHGSITA